MLSAFLLGSSQFYSMIINCQIRNSSLRSSPYLMTVIKLNTLHRISPSPHPTNLTGFYGSDIVSWWMPGAVDQPCTIMFCFISIRHTETQHTGDMTRLAVEQVTWPEMDSTDGCSLITRPKTGSTFSRRHVCRSSMQRKSWYASRSECF